MDTEATSGSRSTRPQSNPGWLGSTTAVAGRVTASSRRSAVSPRRAPATAAMIVPPANATSSARMTRDRQRWRTLTRSHVPIAFICPPVLPAPSHPRCLLVLLKAINPHLAASRE